MDELSQFIFSAYPYKAIIAVIKGKREWVLRCSTPGLAGTLIPKPSKANIDPYLQSIIDADNDNVLIRSSVNILGTINLVASNTPGLGPGGELSATRCPSFK